MIRIREREALRYMGCKAEPESVEEEIRKKLREAEEILQRTAQPRSIYARYPFVDGKLGSLCPEGKSIRSYLSGVKEAYVFAATLGAGVDRALARAEKTDILLACALQAAAASCIECFCDDQCVLIGEKEALRGLYLQPRYSPGYGDLPLSMQAQILQLLDAEKRIGLCCSLHDMLIPVKSVTALIGLSDCVQKSHGKDCRACEKKDCAFRKTENFDAAEKE